MKRLLAIIFSITISWAVAQPYTSNQGAFQVDQKEGCAPLTVTITEAGFAGFCACDYRVGTTSINNTHTFTQPGTYVITGNAQAGANPAADQITITVNANTQPDFEISSCNGNQVSIKVLTTQFDSYIVDFDNNAVDDVTISQGGNQTANFSYSSSGAKTISVRGKNLDAFDNCARRNQAFTAIPSLTAATIQSLVVNDAASITLNYLPTANTQYRAVISTNTNTSFQPFQTFNNSGTAIQTLTQTGLNPNINYYCYRINAIDPCTNSSTNSNTICSANFDVTAVSDENQLTWSTSTAGVSDYTILRDQVFFQTETTHSYTDANLACNTLYEYGLVINYADGSTSTALPQSVTSITNTIPSKIENTTALVGDNGVNLSWQTDPAFIPVNYFINRNSGGGTFQLFGASPSQPYDDDSYLTASNFCYQISYTDACQKTSPLSESICPVRLFASVNNQNAIQLNWSEYLGWKDGARRYRLEKFDATGTLIFSQVLNALTYLDDEEDPENQIVEYIVTAIPRNSLLTESVSNRIRIKRSFRLIFPTAFTPNKDRLNDTFSVAGQYVESMKLQVFDRWGRLLFSTEDNEAWNGTFEGRVMPESTYIWKAFITDKTGATFSEIGSVALLRIDK